MKRALRSTLSLVAAAAVAAVATGALARVPAPPAAGRPAPPSTTAHLSPTAPGRVVSAELARLKAQLDATARHAGQARARIARLQAQLTAARAHYGLAGEPIRIALPVAVLPAAAPPAVPVS